MSDAVNTAEPKKEFGWYENGVWQGRPKYQCEFCNYDSLHVTSIRDHVLEFHQAKMIDEDRKHKLSTPLFDGNGRVIEEY